MKHKIVGVIFLISVAVLVVALNHPKPKQNVYENQYMKVMITDGWMATKAKGAPYAVNITKGNYILYINTQAQQSSGIIGGRFAEISMGAPSADAVMKDQPNPPCGQSEQTAVSSFRSRIDLYLNNQTKETYCRTPQNGSTVWYFSYITDSTGTYFNYYKTGEPLSVVITMAYNSKDVNKLPTKGSPELNSRLSEMSQIVQSLEIKQK